MENSQTNLNGNMIKVIGDTKNTKSALPVVDITLFDMENVQNTLNENCNESFLMENVKQDNDRKTTNNPWWSDELTTLRKYVNSKRRLYQRTYNNQPLREERKSEYHRLRKQYSDLLTRSKLKYSKQSNDDTDKSQPYNEIGIEQVEEKYSNIDNVQEMDIHETLEVAIDKFVPCAGHQDSEEVHKR